MKTTEYLTGQHTERYKPLLDPLVDMRIKDMRTLLNELREAARVHRADKIEYELIKTRYQDVEKAIKWWIELKHEGEVEHGD